MTAWVNPKYADAVEALTEPGQPDDQADRGLPTGRGFLMTAPADDDAE